MKARYLFIRKELMPKHTKHVTVEKPRVTLDLNPVLLRGAKMAASQRKIRTERLCEEIIEAYIANERLTGRLPANVPVDYINPIDFLAEAADDDEELVQ